MIIKKNGKMIARQKHNINREPRIHENREGDSGYLKRECLFE